LQPFERVAQFNDILAGPEAIAAAGRCQADGFTAGQVKQRLFVGGYLVVEFSSCEKRGNCHAVMIDKKNIIVMDGVDGVDGVDRFFLVIAVFFDNLVKRQTFNSLQKLQLRCRVKLTAPDIFFNNRLWDTDAMLAAKPEYWL
jgi:hypothetical protein